MKKILILLLMVLPGLRPVAQNYKFQALFLYNIAQKIEWPTPPGVFNIGVIGCNEMEKELLPIAQTRKLGGQTIQVRAIPASFAGADECQLIYLGRSASAKMGDLLTATQAKPVLLISDKVGLTGAGINFIDNSSKLEFEIYPTAIKSHRLNLANALLNLGIVKQ